MGNPEANLFQILPMTKKYFEVEKSSYFGSYIANLKFSDLSVKGRKFVENFKQNIWLVLGYADVLGQNRLVHLLITVWSLSVAFGVSDMWQIKYKTWQITHNTWHMTHDTIRKYRKIQCLRYGGRPNCF